MAEWEILSNFHFFFSIISVLNYLFPKYICCERQAKERKNIRTRLLQQTGLKYMRVATHTCTYCSSTECETHVGAAMLIDYLSLCTQHFCLHSAAFFLVTHSPFYALASLPIIIQNPLQSQFLGAVLHINNYYQHFFDRLKPVKKVFTKTQNTYTVLLSTIFFTILWLKDAELSALSLLG